MTDSTTPQDSAAMSPASDGSVAGDPLSVCCRHLANSQRIIEAKNAEIARLRMTDAERDAIQWAIERTAQMYDDRDGGPIKREAIRDFLRRTR